MEENTFMILNQAGDPIAQAMPKDIVVILLEALMDHYYNECWTIAPYETTWEDDDGYFTEEEQALKRDAILQRSEKTGVTWWDHNKHGETWWDDDEQAWAKMHEEEFESPLAKQVAKIKQRLAETDLAKLAAINDKRAEQSTKSIPISNATKEAIYAARNKSKEKKSEEM